MANTYTIRESVTGYRDYTIEAATEEEAIDKIECGWEDPDDVELEGDGCEVIEVEYGENEFTVEIHVTIMATEEVGATNRADAFMTQWIREDSGNFVSSEIAKATRYDIVETRYEG